MWPRAGPGGAWLSVRNAPLPKTRFSAARRSKLTTSPPWHSQETGCQRGHRTVPGRGYGYLAPGKGKGEAQGETEGCCPPFSTYSPFPRRMYEKSVQGRAQPPGSGVNSTPPGRGEETGAGVEATPPSRRIRRKQRQHNDGGAGRARKVESQVKEPCGQGAASRW